MLTRILNSRRLPFHDGRSRQLTAALTRRDDSTTEEERVLFPGLIDIQDEQIRRKLPQNCGLATDGNGTAVIQTVVRNKQPQIIRYEYDFETLNELQKRPLQFSFLLVHEWLWDHSGDPQVIRWANQFLHSRRSEKLSPEDFKTSLKNIGITSQE